MCEVFIQVCKPKVINSRVFRIDSFKGYLARLALPPISLSSLVAVSLSAYVSMRAFEDLHLAILANPLADSGIAEIAYQCTDDKKIHRPSS